MKKVTVIGGGTGTYVVLSGLKDHELDLGVIVTMMDSGGSTGRLRDQLGVLPPGDLRQSLVALSDAQLLWRELFLYRFEHGDLAGHNFGNIFLSALEKVCKNYDEVIETVSYVLKTRGKVIPVTFAQTHLCVVYENGTLLKGEGNIDTNKAERARVRKAFLEPEVKANPKAIERIATSDYIIIGPGDVYSSIVPVLLVDGIKSTLSKSKAKIIYVANLMTKAGQTTNYTTSDHITDLETYLGKKIDAVIVNNGEIPKDILEWYVKEGEKPVENDLIKAGYGGKIIIDDVIDIKTFDRPPGDKLIRSILRHDSGKLATSLLELLV